MGTHDTSLLTDDDIYLFNEGSHFRLYDKFGAHSIEEAGVSGSYFAVWAPDAEQVSVIGDFNGWNMSADTMQSVKGTDLFILEKSMDGAARSGASNAGRAHASAAS